jgi:hypothetical protein
VAAGDGEWAVSENVLDFELTEYEVRVLAAGLDQWGGPGRPTHELAVALGWSSLADLDAGCGRLAATIQSGAAMTALDWTRALAAAEIAFASDVFGAGYE